MPESFDKCVAHGGKVWTETQDGRYRHVCRWPKGTTQAGKTEYGHWKKRKGKSKK